MQYLTAPSFVETLETRRLLHAVYVDPSFGADGALALQGLALSEQPGGKIVVALKNVGLGDERNLAITRLNPDGTTDSTFKSHGVTHTDVLGGDDSLQQIATDTSGLIYVLSTSFTRQQPTTPHQVVIRYMASGQVDYSFANHGQLEAASVFPGFVTTGLTVDQSNRLVLCGRLNDVNGQLLDSCAVARFEPNYGLPDESFGAKGLAVRNLGDHATPRLVQTMSNGKIVLGAENPAESGQITLLRYTQHGTPDKTFGVRGASVHVFTTDLNGTTGPTLSDLVFAPEAAIVYAGKLGDGGRFVVRTRNDGTLDTSFGANGVINYVDVTSINVRLDNLLLMATDTGAASGSLRLFDQSGQPIDSFGNQGILLGFEGHLTSFSDGTIFSQSDSTIWRLMLDPETGSKLSSDGALRVIGSEGDDTIIVAHRGANIVATVNGASKRYDASKVADIGVSTGPGNDHVTLFTPAAVDGGSGDDAITGSDGNDSLYGVDGADTISGGDGNDIVDGGGGMDTLVGDAGNDSLYGGYGRDSLRAGDGNDLLFGDAFVAGSGGFQDTLDGGPGTDTASFDSQDRLRSIEIDFNKQYAAG